MILSCLGALVAVAAAVTNYGFRNGKLVYEF